MEEITPLLSLCMIVKNEEAYIERCLESVKDIVDEIIIVDTGSTDKTIAIAKKNATLLVQIPWNDNFAKARNVSLDEASGEWILVLDADETLHQEDLQKLKALIQREKTIDGFFLNMLNRKKNFTSYHEENFLSLRLFRNLPSYRFEGEIHEQITGIPHEKLTISNIRIIHHGHESLIKNKERRKRNMLLLEKHLTENPLNHYQRFNLAMEYMADGDYKKTITHLEQITAPSKKSMWVSRYYKMLAYSYLKEQAWKKSIKTIEDGKVLFPDYPDLFYLEGMVLVAQDKYKEALFPFYTCLAIGESIHPNYISEKGMGSYKAYYALGSTYEALGKMKKARICYQDAIESNEAYVEAGTKLANILLQEVSIDHAMLYLRHIYDESKAEHLLILAKICLEIKQFTHCESFMHKAIELGADTNTTNQIKGLCNFYQGKTKEMKKYLSTSNLILLSLKESIEVLNRGVEQYPSATLLKQQRKKIETILQQMVLGELDE